MSRKMVKVVKMDLSSKKLSSLSGMRSIDITQYPLKVKLSSNQFETVPTTELTGLDLRVLDMSKNIIQSLPESISELQKLEVLNLAGNRLRNMGEEMLALTNLRILDLSGNQLASVPPVVSQMVCLEALRLTKNLLHVLPTTLTFLTNLQELEVSGNPLLSPPINVIHRGTTAILAHLETISNTIGAPINPFTPLLRPPYIAEWIKATPDCPTASRSHPKTLFPTVGPFELFDGHFYVSHCVFTDQGCREYMEDTYIAINHMILPYSHSKKRGRRPDSSKLISSAPPSPAASDEAIRPPSKAKTSTDDPSPSSAPSNGGSSGPAPKLSRMAHSNQSNGNVSRRSASISTQRASSPSLFGPVDISGPPGERLALFSVFDGHAGPRCSKFLKEHFARLVFDLKATRRGEIPIGLYKAFAKAESQYCAAAKTNGWNDGSTGVVAAVHGQQLIMAHVGDSRAVMCREKRAICLTSDHKPDREDEEKRIKQLGGTVERHEAGGSIARVNGHLAVSRAFGDLRMKETERFVSAEPEISVIPLTPQDKFVIIASDGLWDVLSNQEAVDAVRREPNKHKAAKNLVKRALKIGTTDNITVLIVWLTWVHNHPLPNTRGSGIGLTSSASDAVTTTSDNTPEDDDNQE